MSDTSNLKEKAKLVWQRLRVSKLSLTPQRKTEIVNRVQSKPHKPGVNPKDWEIVHPNLLLIAEFDLNLCEELSLPVLYSSIIRPKIPGVSVSDSHAQKRAYDRSVREWPEGMAKWISELVCDAFEVGAISFSDGKERESIYEPTVKDKDGNVIKVEHLHFQVRP